MTPARPLDNYPFVRTRSVEGARQALARIYAKPTLELDDCVRALDVSINNYQLQDVGLTYATYGAAVRLGYSEADFVVQFFPIHGTGEVVVERTLVSLVPERGVTISSHVDYQANFSADYGHLVLRISAKALMKKLAAMTGAAIDAPLRISPIPNYDRPAAQSLRRYFLLLVSELNSATTSLPAWVQAQTEQLLMVMFLCANAHNYSHLLERQPPDAAPAQVRRAEEFIEANGNRPIILDDLAAITGVSALSLFRSFQQHRGYSPLEFARQVRLRNRSKHR
jgi:hypothetical protein